MDQRAIGPLLSTDADAVIPRAFNPTLRDARQALVLGESKILCGAFGGSNVVRWIEHTANRQFNRRDLTITVINKLRNTAIEASLYDCLLTGVTFPALNKASTADAVMSLSFQAQRLTTRPIGGTEGLPLPPQLKPWRICEFEFEIDGIVGASSVQRVEPLTIKQGVKTVSPPGNRTPEIEPTRIEDSNVIVSLPFQSGKSFLDWSAAVTAKPNDYQNEKSGRLKYLARDKSVVAIVEFLALGPIAATKSGDRLRVEMYATGMTVQSQRGGF